MKKLFFFFFFVVSLSIFAQETETVESYEWNIPIIVSNSVNTNDTTVTVNDSTKNNFSTELIALGGGGYSLMNTGWSSYAFGEARWMFGQKVRIGPYISYIAFNGEETYKTPKGQYIGREWSIGGSLDSYGGFTLKSSYYSWLNVSYRNIKDSYQENFFASDTKTEGVGIMFGFFITSNQKNWLGNHRLMLSGFIPTKAEVAGTWKGVKINDLKPYNKQQARGVYELGLKRFGNKIEFEPLVHTGYGYEWGANRQFYEIGAGFNFGVFKDWYHEVFKAKVFWRQDLKANQLSGWQAEITFNLSQFVQSFKK